MRQVRKIALRLDPAYEPIPDVIAGNSIGWSVEKGSLEPTETIGSPDDRKLSAQDLWAEVDAQLRQR